MQLQVVCYFCEVPHMTTDKTLRARRFILEVQELAKKYELPFFVVTDGASAISNDNCDAVDHARCAHIEWEHQNGIDPEHDWLDEITK